MTTFDPLSLLIATLFFTIQIYCDFSSYCDIAMGSARILGYRLPINFNRPYGSVSITDFWRRWHVTLGTWFRDYVYHPLGGSRNAAAVVYCNVLVVFLLSGVWHGANWTFIVWGGLHAVFMIAERATASVRNRVFATGVFGNSPAAKANLGRAWTLFIVIIAWIFFRAESISDATFISSSILSGFPGYMFDGSAWATQAEALNLTPAWLAVWLTVSVLVIARHWALPVMEFQTILEFRQRWLRHASYVGLTFLILFFGNMNKVQFIYFQF